mgnify:FL=1|jgi:hypothetical protein
MDDFDIDFKSNKTVFPYLKKQSGKHAKSEYSELARKKYMEIQEKQNTINNIVVNKNTIISSKKISELIEQHSQKFKTNKL